jgi:hypothetical protein
MRDSPVIEIRPSLLPIPGPPFLAARIERILLAALVYGVIRLFF